MAGIRNMGMVNLAIMALVASSVWAVSRAQSSGSGSSSSCTNALVSMASCLNYITGNSSTPTSSCCTQLQSVVKNTPQCLCQVISGSSSSVAGININQTQALTLPTACNVQTPPTSRCSSGASPSGSPAGATPTDSTTPQGGSKATPTSEGGSSDANKIMSKSAAVVPLFLAVSVIVGFVAL